MSEWWWRSLWGKKRGKEKEKEGKRKRKGKGNGDASRSVLLMRGDVGPRVDAGRQGAVRRAPMANGAGAGLGVSRVLVRGGVNAFQ